MESEASIDQLKGHMLRRTGPLHSSLKGHSPESCLSWLRSHEGCPKHDLFPVEYSRCARLSIIYQCYYYLVHDVASQFR